MARMKWLRFSLRTLLLLIAVLCVWLGIQVNAARRQREAVTAILKAGGTVYYDYQFVPLPRPLGSPRGWGSDKQFDKSQSPPGPAWLRQWVGDEYFRTVVLVNFYDAKPNFGRDLEQL